MINGKKNVKLKGFGTRHNENLALGHSLMT